MKRSLTDRQLAVLVFMKEFFRENDQLPTAPVISQHLGLKSSTCGARFCARLEQRGYIERNAAGWYRFTREVAHG